jgi:hypothetical protein
MLPMPLQETDCRYAFLRSRRLKSAMLYQVVQVMSSLKSSQRTGRHRRPHCDCFHAGCEAAIALQELLGTFGARCCRRVAECLGRRIGVLSRPQPPRSLFDRHPRQEPFNSTHLCITSSATVSFDYRLAVDVVLQVSKDLQAAKMTSMVENYSHRAAESPAVHEHYWQWHHGSHGRL